jgi:hypothetical protein
VGGGGGVVTRENKHFQTHLIARLINFSNSIFDVFSSLFSDLSGKNNIETDKK